MKRLIIFILSAALLAACGPGNKAGAGTDPVASSMRLIEYRMIGPWQIDSMMAAERLPDIGKWTRTLLISDETREPIEQWLMMTRTDSTKTDFTLTRLAAADTSMLYRKIIYRW